MEGGARFYRDTAEIGECVVSRIDGTREHLIETYRKKAKHYDITSRFYPVRGYPDRHSASGPYKHSAFAGVTASLTSHAAQV
jgi:hypothetical protein